MSAQCTQKSFGFHQHFQPQAEREPMVPCKGTTSRSSPPVRTVRESFPSHRSSLSRAYEWTRFLCSWVALPTKSRVWDRAVPRQ
jgi:hypothetical protein